MAKGGKQSGDMDKASSMAPSSMKLKSHVAAPNKAGKLDMTKAHPLHNGKTSSNPYSAYKAN